MACLRVFCRPSRAARRGGVLPTTLTVLFRATLVLLAVVGLAAVLRGVLGPRRPAMPGRIDGPTPATASPALQTAEQSTIALFEAVSPAVVYIETAEYRQDLFSLNVFKIPRGSGSGFVWDREGHIVTNLHVIEGADEPPVVTLADQTKWRAEVVGAEPDKDLAVLRIEAPRSRLYPIPLGASDDLQVGQSVFAIGNPFGLDQTLTTGVISGLGREIEARTRRLIKGVIQTDAAINPGNSGGPLLDSGGRLIGVNTAIIGASPVFAGVGFAVPVDAVRRIVPQLIQYGAIRRPTLGVILAEDSLTRRLRLAGALVTGVFPGSTADRAGLRPSYLDAQGRLQVELIVAADGEPVRRRGDLLDVLENREPGDRVVLTVRRGNRTLDIPVILSPSPS